MILFSRWGSESKFLITYWFMDYWIRRPIFCYGLMDREVILTYGFLNPECIFWITDWWIQNDCFDLCIPRSRINCLTYGLMDPKWVVIALINEYVNIVTIINAEEETI